MDRVRVCPPRRTQAAAERCMEVPLGRPRSRAVACWVRALAGCIGCILAMGCPPSLWVKEPARGAAWDSHGGLCSTAGVYQGQAWGGVDGEVIANLSRGDPSCTVGQPNEDRGRMRVARRRHRPAAADVGPAQSVGRARRRARRAARLARRRRMARFATRRRCLLGPASWDGAEGSLAEF